MFEAEFHREFLALLPVANVIPIVCEDCEEVHGIGLELGWLFWSVRLGWVWDEEF